MVAPPISRAAAASFLMLLLALILMSRRAEVVVCSGFAPLLVVSSSSTAAARTMTITFLRRPQRATDTNSIRLFDASSTVEDLNRLDDDDDDDDDEKDRARRLCVLSSVATTIIIAAAACSTASTAVQALGWLQFPCAAPLSNTYHFLRAGTSLLEEEGMLSTNPLFLTFRDDALSPAGEEQIASACEKLKEGNRAPTLVRYSLAARCMDTANIVVRELNLGRDRVILEYQFLDPRGIGAWDMTDRSVTLPAVVAMDHDEAGKDGLQGRPPPNDDGTPDEVLADQATRLRQFLSGLETQYSGETVLVIAPDGTGLALLSAMMAGIPYNRAHELEFEPGELRCYVAMDSVLELWKQKQKEDGEKHQTVLKQGRENLRQLRAGKGTANLKDKRIEEERIAIDDAYQEKERKRMLAAEEKEKEGRMMQRQQEVPAQQQAENSKMAPVAVAAAAVVTAIGGAALASVGGTEGPAATMSTDTTIAEPPSLSDDSATNLSDAELLLPAPTGPLLDLDPNAGMDLFPSSTPSSPEENMGRRRKVERDHNGSFSVVEEETVVDPKEAADQAMKEYMERDDGGGDWLLSLTEIVEEADDLASSHK